jgi:hypothetical protein
MSLRLRDWSVTALLLAAIASVAWGVHRADVYLDARSRTLAATGDVGPLPDGRVVRVLSLGFERLAADLFWLRTVYYVGDETSMNAGYPAAARLANLVTDIDPEFNTAYVLMNSVLTVLRPEAEAAIALLDKGILHLPDRWRLRFLQGFNHFMYRSDYARAAELMREAAERGGPQYIPLLTTRLYAEAGDPDTALAFVAARLQNEQSPEARSALERRFRDIWVVRDLGRIDRAIAHFVESHGAPPERVRDLVAAGLLPEEPRDPDGGRYEIRDAAAASRIDYDPLELRGAGGMR